MNTLYKFLRTPIVKHKLLYPTICVKEIYFEKNTQSSNSSSSSSSSDSDIESKKSDISGSKAKREESLNKLNSLLRKIVEEDVVHTQTKLNLAQPSNKRLIKKSEAEKVKDGQTIEKQIVNAAKDVAQNIGGNVKQTESELIMKLLGPSDNSSLSSTNLSDIIKGLKIDRESKPVEKSRADEIRSLLQNVKPSSVPNFQEKRKQRRPIQQKKKPEMVVQKIDLFGGEPLGIFTNKELKDSPENKTLELLFQRDLKLAVTHPPANYFQQMILWTEQGKLWKFPLDNEQDLKEEKKVYFTEHIFLEEHLEPWCPQKGPIRQFMELVCVGLSKNCYLTVQAKKEHIEWYKNYFEDKRKLLQEVGAFPPQTETQKSLE